MGRSLLWLWILSSDPSVPQQQQQQRKELLAVGVEVRVLDVRVGHDCEVGAHGGSETPHVVLGGHHRRLLPGAPEQTAALEESLELFVEGVLPDEVDDPDHQDLLLGVHADQETVVHDAEPREESRVGPQRGLHREEQSDHNEDNRIGTAIIIETEGASRSIFDKLNPRRYLNLVLVTAKVAAASASAFLASAPREEG